MGRPSHKPLVRYKSFRYQVTTLETDSRAVVRFYNANEVRLWLSIIAYNLGILGRLVALPGPAA